MGFAILQETGIFVPRKYGIKANTPVTAIVIGGGGGGGDGYNADRTSGKGGRSGEGGSRGQKQDRYYGGYGGGGGAGFGAGGGGGGSMGDVAGTSGSGGGGGQILIRNILFEDIDEEIPVSIAQKVNTAGQSTSLGTYATAIGGERGIDGIATSDNTTSSKGGKSADARYRGGNGAYGAAYGGAGGGGGAGGYFIGSMMQGGDGGYGQAGGSSSSSTNPGYGGGGGGAGNWGYNGGTSRSITGYSNVYGCGAAFSDKIVGGSGFDPSGHELIKHDGFTYLHSGLDNSGAIILFW